MKKFIIASLCFLAIICLIGTCSEKRQQNNKEHEISRQVAQEYAESLVEPDLGIYKATITDANMLIVAVDAHPGANFDIFAKSYLDGALDAGVNVKGCFIVDIKDCQFQKGAVIGKRIGKAYNH